MKRSSIALVLGLAGAAGLGLASSRMVAEGCRAEAACAALPQPATGAASCSAVAAPVKLEAVEPLSSAPAALQIEPAVAAARQRASSETPAQVVHAASIEQAQATPMAAPSAPRTQLMLKQRLAIAQQRAGGKPGYGQARPAGQAALKQGLLEGQQIRSGKSLPGTKPALSARTSSAPERESVPLRK